MELHKSLSPRTPVDSFEQCMSHLWERHVQLRKQIDLLQSDVVKLELEKARLTYECSTLCRYIDTWKKAEKSYRRMATMLSKQMSSALNVLCSTQVCSDGRTIADHMRDAHRKLGLLPEEPKKELIPDAQDDESSEFYF